MLTLPALLEDPLGHSLTHACLILLFSVSEGSFQSICEALGKGLNLLDVLEGCLPPTYSWTYQPNVDYVAVFTMGLGHSGLYSRLLYPELLVTWRWFHGSILSSLIWDHYCNVVVPSSDSCSLVGGSVFHGFWFCVWKCIWGEEINPELGSDLCPIEGWPTGV